MHAHTYIRMRAFISFVLMCVCVHACAEHVCLHVQYCLHYIFPPCTFNHTFFELQMCVGKTCISRYEKFAHKPISVYFEPKHAHAKLKSVCTQARIRVSFGTECAFTKLRIACLRARIGVSFVCMHACMYVFMYVCMHGTERVFTKLTVVCPQARTCVCMHAYM